MGGFYAFSRKTRYSFKEIAQSINKAIEEIIKDNDISFHAESGRFITTNYLDLCISIICAKHFQSYDKLSQLIYIPDCIYGVVID